MKIVICCSMSAAKKCMQIAAYLREQDHEIVIPQNIDKYADGTFSIETANESAQHKIERDLIRDYYNEIKNADSVLAINEEKRGIENYIGGNTFLELGFAHVLNKNVFILNGIPEISYRDEIIALQPIVLNGDLTRIK